MSLELQQMAHQSGADGDWRCLYLNLMQTRVRLQMQVLLLRVQEQ
jgi:hypothetical protein